MADVAAAFGPPGTYYPGAIVRIAYRSRIGITRKANRIRRLLIHITDGHGSIDGLAEMWQRPGVTCAQLAVGQDGRVLQTMPLEAICWHAHSAGLDAIGIEHCARSPHELGRTKEEKAKDPGLALSKVQLASSAKVAAFCAQAFYIPIDRVHILGHKEADARTDHDDCPEGVMQPDGVTQGWPWDAYLAEIRRLS